MAVSIPREIYTLGAVGLDTSRLANLEGQILAKREAKRLAEQEAIDRYMMELGGKLTPTGVRTSDLPGFEARRKAWMDFGLKNKSKLKTDLLVRSEFDRLFNNTLSYTQASKNEEEKAKTAKTMLADPTKRQQLNTEALMADISLHDLPLDDPSRKSIDYNAAWYKPATFDFTKEFTEASKGQPKSFLRVVPGSRNTTLGTVATEEGWTPKSINAIADNFARSVRDNPDKYEYYVRRAKTLTPAELTDLNKELVGIGIVADDDDPLAVAYADALRQARSAIDVIQKPDTELAQSRAMARSFAAKQADAAVVNLYDYDVLGKYNPQVVNIVKPGATAEEREAIPTEVVFEKDIPTEDLELITNKGEVGAITEKGMKPYFKVRSDGNWEGSQGKVIDRSLVARSNLDKTSLAEERRLRQGLIKTTAPKVPATTKKKGELD